MKNPIQNYITERARFRDGNYVKVLEYLNGDEVKTLIDKRSWHKSCYGDTCHKQIYLMKRLLHRTQGPIMLDAYLEKEIFRKEI